MSLPMKKEVVFHFKEFKQYARFLLEDLNLLRELADHFQEQIRKHQIPMMRFLDKLPFTQRQNLMQNNLQRFLEHSLTDTALVLAAEKVDKWREHNSSKALRKKTDVADLLKVYHVQKELLISKLNLFTEDFIAFSSIIQELDQFQALLEEYAYDADPEAFYKERDFIDSWINNSVDGIICFDKHLRIRLFNAVIEEWSKRNHEELIGLPVFEALPAFRDTEKYPEEGVLLEKVVRGEKVHIPERPFLHKEGYYEMDVVPLLDKDGMVSGGLCFVHETTEKRKTENEKKKSQMLLQKVANTSPTILFVYDLEEKRKVFINRTVEDILGYEIDQFGELTKDIYTHLFHPEDVDRGILHLEQIKFLSDEEVISLEYRMKDSKGKWHWFRSLDTVFKRDEKGEVIQMLSNAQDITAQKEAENTIFQKNQELIAALEKLQNVEKELKFINAELEERVKERTSEISQSEQKIQRREEQLHLIADALPVYIAYIKSDRTFGYLNKTYEQFFQRNKEEILGKHVKEIIGEDLYKKQEEIINRCFKGESIKFESKRDYDDRPSNWFNVSFIPKSVEDQIVGMYVLVEDITEYKNTQFKLETLLLQLKEANEEKGIALNELEGKNIDLQKINNDLDNFVYVASHDLSSPVNNLEGLIQIIQEKFKRKADSEDEAILRMAGVAIGRLKRTIGDLVDVIKVQSKTKKETGEEGLVRFKEITQDVKEDIHSLIAHNQVTIIENYKIEEVNYQKSNLRSIIYNLLSNAVKYLSPDRPLLIKIETYLEDDYLVLSVKDNGLGLSFDQLKKLFSLFNRMHQHVEGTGIGLYSIKRIIDSSGGKVDVKSEEGKGSQFLVYLPVVANT